MLVLDEYMGETHNHLSLETAKKWGQNTFFITSEKL